MTYERSYAREWAQIQGITLLQNILKQLENLELTLMTLSESWIENRILNIEQQVQLIFGVSANDVTSQYLVFCINKLNDHLISEFPHREYTLKLTKKAIHAMERAIQAHSHIWSTAQLQSVLTALGSAHVVRTKGSPYYYNIEQEDKKKEKKIEVLEYKPE